MDTYEFNAPVVFDFENIDDEHCPDADSTVKDLKVGDPSEEKMVTCAEDAPEVVDEKLSENVEHEESRMETNEESVISEPNKDLVKTDEIKFTSETPEGKSSRTKTGKTPQRNLNVPVRQSPRLAAIAKSIRRANASRGMLPSSNRSSLNSHRRSLSEGSNIVTNFSKVKKATPQRKIAVVRPEHHEKSLLAEDDLSTLQHTTNITKALQNNRQKAKKGVIKAGPLKPTKPVGFNFATDSRVGKKMETNASENVNFERTLRVRSMSSSCENLKVATKGPTKVQPFNLHNPSKPREEVKPFISLAELSLKFHLKTPDRFRSKRLNSEPHVENGKKTRSHSGVTQPQTPKLTTRLRSRPVDIPTREEIEAKELEEAQKHKFKARPLNKKILQEPDLKPLDTTKIGTVPEPFNITDTRKAESKLNRTLAESCKEMMNSACSIPSIPHGGVSTQWDKKRTEPKPFSFDSRDMEMIRKKKEKIQKLIEEEKKAAEFHAQPMPIHDTVKGLPPKKVNTPTKVKPFKLMSDIRGSARQQSLQKELEALEEMEKNQRKFEAQPDTVVHKKPFVPQKSKKPLTDISGFSLNTDKRAEERREFDAQMKEKEDLLKAEKEALEERKRQEEEEMVKEMRKSAVHKAQPIRNFKPVEIKQGILPPTLPVTPNFATDRRIRSRSSSKQNVTTLEADSTNVDGTFTME